MQPRLAAAIVIFVATTAFAQSTAGLAGISGIVRDATGAVVPNANVVVSNPHCNVGVGRTDVDHWFADCEGAKEFRGDNDSGPVGVKAHNMKIGRFKPLL